MNVHSRFDGTPFDPKGLPMQITLQPSEVRSDEILQSIRGMFAEKGFDGASMQDLARAAGMSVGNFYRYFPSKAAIVEAIVNRDLDEVRKDFSEIMLASDKMQALRAKLRERISSEMCGDDGALWAEMSASAFRKPEIGQALARMHTEITRFMLNVFARSTGLSDDAAALRFGTHADFIMLLFKSAATKEKNPVANSDALQEMILRTVDGVLSEISEHAVKG